MGPLHNLPAHESYILRILLCVVAFHLGLMYLCLHFLILLCIGTWIVCKRRVCHMLPRLCNQNRPLSSLKIVSRTKSKSYESVLLRSWYCRILILGALDMRCQIANEARSAELAIIISYPTSASGIIVLLKTSTTSRWISPTRTNRKRQGTFAIHMSHVYQNCQRANRLAWTAWMKNQNIVAMNIYSFLKTHRDSRILHSRTAKKNLADNVKGKNF